MTLGHLPIIINRHLRGHKHNNMTHLLFKDMQRSPFDILVKNFFDKESGFDKPNRHAVTHPIDVYETPDGLTFEVACTGLNRDDVDVKIEGDSFNVSYDY